MNKPINNVFRDFERQSSFVTVYTPIQRNADRKTEHQIKKQFGGHARKALVDRFLENFELKTVAGKQVFYSKFSGSERQLHREVSNLFGAENVNELSRLFFEQFYRTKIRQQVIYVAKDKKVTDEKQSRERRGLLRTAASLLIAVFGPR